MAEKFQGIFSQSFISLQLQLKNLLEGSGGNGSIELLDTLSKLGKYEQEVVVSRFLAVINRIADGDKRFLSEEDHAQKEMEDSLYGEIISAMSDAGKIPNISGRRLEVLDGGKRSRKAKPHLQLAGAEKGKRSGLKPVFN